MNKKIILSAVAAGVMFSGGLVFAQVSGNQTIAQPTKVESDQKTSEPSQTNPESPKDQRKNDKCKNIEARVSSRVNRYENNQAMMQKVFSRMTERLNRLVVRLDSKGVDVSKLNEDLITLAGKVEKLNTDYVAFLDQLKSGQNLACAPSDGEFKGKVGEARKLLPTIIADRQDIKTFFLETVKADLLEIKTQLTDKKEQQPEKKEASDSEKAPKTLEQ